MKPLHTFRFKTMTFLVCMFCCCCAISAHTASVEEAQKKASPFATISTLLQDQGMDNVSLLTVIPSETLNLISPQLKKVLKVKDYVSFDTNSTVGNVLTTLLKSKYGKKSNEKNDFFSIQYSTSSSDFEKYLKKYPHSKFADEAKARFNCFKENELWLTAQEDETKDAYEAFADLCAKNTVCNYEGCEGIGMQNRKMAEAISKWYALADRSKGNDPSLFSDYISQYGSYSPFAAEATDSLNVNQDRFDWNVASTKDNKAAYESYLAKHKKGLYSSRAENLVEELDLWEKAKTSGKYTDYCAYYAEYPEGKHADETIAKLKQEEEAAWAQAKKTNTIKSYENFVNKYPSGYYANDAQNKISDLRLAPFLNDPASIGDLTYLGGYSQPGYSLIFFGNADKSKTITFSLTGPTGFSKSVKPGNYEWVKVKNGKYKILLQASNTENYWGSCSFEDRIYGDSWNTVTRVGPFDFTGTSNANPKYTEKFTEIIEERVLKELFNALGDK